MRIVSLLSVLESSPDFKMLINALRQGGRTGLSLQIPEQANSFLAAAFHHAMGAPVLLLTAHPEIARRRVEQAESWLPADAYIAYYPEKELRGTGASADPVIRAEKVRTLSMLSENAGGGWMEGATPFIVTNAVALMDLLPGAEEYKSAKIEMRAGSGMSIVSLLESLESAGYEYDHVVEVPGTFGRRGGIVDVYPSGSDAPVRIEFFGNQVDNIRLFDPKTQRSGKQIGSITIPPVTLAPNIMKTNILDYFPESTVVLVEDMAQLESEINKIAVECSEAGQSAGEQGDDSFDLLPWSPIKEKLQRFRHLVEVTPWSEVQKDRSEAISLNIKAAPSFALRLQVFLEQICHLRASYGCLIIVSQQVERLSELLAERGISAGIVDDIDVLPAKGSLTLLRGSMDGGWQLADDLLLLTDAELFGIVKQRRSYKPRPVHHHRFLNDINIGDFAVHIEHGIGKFAGVKKKIVDGVEREYFILEYAGSDVLYVPTEQVDRLSLYLGSGDRVPSLSRLGTQEWNRARQKVKESVAEIAGELIKIYAVREAMAGQAFSSDTLWQQEMEASFPYVETPDQLDAVTAVKADMESSRPMDRLVCGDVGYGKTEVAIRAAFKAVMDARQVAVLVPTTILAQQHMNTFSERLRAFPLKVAMLSRFCSSAEQADTIEQVKEGAIDICIGTHRLLQKDVVFKDLGLVIVDEEQRFGVAHKEHFKKMRQTVDVLTLSATPIPRTLHMSLSGIRDMSIIETPPENRLPVVTYVGEFSGKLVRDAILREIERDGQVFFVHNRVQSIGMVAEKLRELVPEVRIAIAHGQMDEEQLEKVMADFQTGKIDVLLTTTIIESGLDLPNVNTLIVNAADKMGLTQLYQLRGRVGRGANTAYAYFMFDSGKDITDQARERLKTIASAAELGAGFVIAMKDMEIRGAGSLLGVEQSGHIAAVGFNYYCQLLSEAVAELKAGRTGVSAMHAVEKPVLTVDLHLPAFIPEDYIEDMRTRFNFYQRLARMDTSVNVNDVAREMLDRFGDLPQEVSNLLYAVSVRQLASNKGIESVLKKGDQITITFNESADTDKIFALLTRRGAARPGNRRLYMDLIKVRVDWKKELREVLELMPVLHN